MYDLSDDSSSNSRQSFSSEEETDDGEHIDHDYNLPQKHINKGRWSRDEDEILRKAVELQNRIDTDWRLVSDYFPDRTDIQCQHRWYKVLNPDLIKGPWTREITSPVTDEHSSQNSHFNEMDGRQKQQTLRMDKPTDNQTIGKPTIDAIQNLQKYFQDQKERTENRLLFIKGNLHQGDLRFQQTAGRQCTCNCLMFFLNSMYSNISELTASDIDRILTEGNEYYQVLSLRLNVDFPLITEIEGIVPYHKKYFKLSVIEELSGLFGQQRSEGDAYFSLSDAIDKALSASSYTFVLIGDNYQLTYSSCIYKCGSSLYIFDPHSRDSQGYPTATGSAIVIQIRSKDKLIQYLTSFANSLKAKTFEVVSINIGQQTYSQYRQFYLTSQKRKERAKLDQDGNSKTHEIQTESAQRAQKRKHLEEEKKNYIRLKDRTSRAIKRAKMDDKTKKQITDIETSSKEIRRSKLDEKTRKQIAEADTQSRAMKRAKLDDKMKKKITDIETSLRAMKRAKMDDKTKKQISDIETSSRVIRRSKLDEKTRKQIAEADTQSRAMKRAKLDDKMKKKITDIETSLRAMKRAKLDDKMKKKKTAKETLSRASKRSSQLFEYQLTFDKHKKEFPCFICTCCNRTFYRQSVQVLVQEKYTKVDDNLQHKCFTKTLSFDEKEYICTTCNQTLLQGKLPNSSVSNNLLLDPIPEELKSLTQLESILISQRIIFFKILNLPRGGQKGLVGSLVNVPVDTDMVCSSLPRTPDQAGIIPLKLKRKLQYKGHHIFQNIRPTSVYAGLKCLIDLNKFYTNIPSNHDWISHCQNENQEIYESLFEADGFDNEIQESQEVNNISSEQLENATERSAQQESDNEENEGDMDVQTKVRGLQYDTCMNPNNPIDTGKREYSIAPGEGKIPVDVFIDKHCEALAFPTLFPTGRFTLYGDEDDAFNPIKRQPKLSVKKYFIQRLTNKDNRFAINIPYLFYALNVCEKDQIQNAVTIALRKAHRKDMTVGQLKDPEILKEIMIKDQAFQFLQQVRGSPSYWQHAQYELLAIVRSKGIFTWFLTLSCADLQWPETIQAIALQQGQSLTDDEVKDMSYEDKCSWLRQNPVTAARQFDHRLQAFFKDVILSPSNPIGKVTHIFQRTEFQLRGSPHCHAVLWVEDAPKLGHVEDDEIASWIDKYVTCEKPQESDPLHSVVSSKQMHTHSVTCKKKGTFCRFHYPKPPSSKTLLSKPPDDDDPEAATLPQFSKMILAKVNEILTSDIQLTNLSVNKLLEIAGISVSDYNKALQYSKSSTTVTMKREPTAINVNNYNKELLRIWDANMDLQFVCDPYACISYIVAYVTKDERELSQMLKEAAKNYQHADIKTRLKRIGTTYLSHRELSAQEAAYRLLSIPLKRCSTKMVWVPTDLPEDRIAILKPQPLLDTMEDDDTDVYSSNIINRYSKRPKLQSIEQLCLAEFASWYDRVTKKNDSDDDFLIDQGGRNELPKVVKLLDSNEQMIKRNSPAIPRYHVFSVNKEPEKYFHQQLLLFFPWRDELRDLKTEGDMPDGYEQKYKEVIRIIQNNKQHLEHHSELVDQALDDYNRFGPPQHAWDLLDPEAEQNRSDDQTQMPQQDNDEPLQDTRIQVARRPQMLATSIKPQSVTDQQLTKMIHTLNIKQRQVFQHIIHWCKQSLESYKGGKPPPPFHIFLSGGAGTGKSQLIKALYYQACKILQQPGDDPTSPLVLLTSPTGTAAFNIGGTTLHAALNLPRSRYYSLKSNPSLLATFRTQLSLLKILIIDEMSMVGRTMLTHIHLRLQEAKGLTGTNVLFGGVSLLLVGDLHQLPPVMQSKVFDTNIHDVDNIESDELATVLAGLWENNISLVELTEIMRQKEDLSFANMLNRIRIGAQTMEDIEILKSRVCSKSDPSYPSQALHIFPTRADVEQHNMEMLNQMTTEITTITAVTKVPTVVKHFDQTRLIGGLPQSLALCKNARVMLIKNTDVSDGLVNGATGQIVDIIYSAPTANMPKAVLVVFDNARIGRLTRQSSNIPLRNRPNATPILPVEGKEHIGKSESSPEIKRIQIPLVLCWACTIHKVQGATLQNVVMSFKGMRTKGQAYVGFSRVTSIQGLHLLDFNDKKITTDFDVSKEMTRLRTEKELEMITTPLCSHPPDILRIAIFNVQSLGLGHQLNVRHDPFLNSTDVLAFTETWQDTVKPINIPNFPHSSFCQRLDEIGGGVAIYSKQAVLLKQQNTLQNTGLEMIHTEIQLKDQIYNFILLYRTPRHSIKDFQQNLRNLLDNLEQPLTNVLITGDFNINYLDTTMNNSMFQMLSSYGLKQLIQSKTHQSGSLLDHVWTTIDKNSITLHQMFTYYSDHQQIFIDIHTT